MDPSVLARKQLTELKGIAAHLEMRGYQRLKKADLIQAIIRTAQEGADAQAQARAARADLQPEAGSDDRAASAAGPARRTRPGRPAEGETDRTRVRTRTRERTQEEREAEDGAAATADRGSAQTATSRANGEGGGRDADDSGPARGDGGAQRIDDGGPDAGEPGTDDDDDDASRRRRSRRERRRNKGDKGGQGSHAQQDGQPVQRGNGRSESGGQPSQRQQGRVRDDDQGAEPGEVRAGVLDVLPEGYGFLRTSGYLPGDRDAYVSQSAIRRHGLVRGDLVEGPIRAQRNADKVPALLAVEQVNGLVLDNGGGVPRRTDFAELIPVFPDVRLPVEVAGGPLALRAVDLIAPIGMGQRGLIVAPPGAGTSTLLKELACAIGANAPDCHLMVILVDARPEEVTDVQRSVPGEVIASTFDRPADEHIQLAELAIERAKRLVESGQDVVVLLDSITGLSRAYQQIASAPGRVGGSAVDPSTLHPVKRLFGSARNVEDGGSLTILATASDTAGSQADRNVIAELAGAANMELRLASEPADPRGLEPAIDLAGSGTREEDRLRTDDELAAIGRLRAALDGLDAPAAMALLGDKLRASEDNAELLAHLQPSA
jgi:transcription termination factor Rho